MSQSRKTAIVTGAASGIGRSMALGLARSGVDVLAVDRAAAALASVAESAKGLAGRYIPHVADLAQPESFEAITQAALALSGQIDILINNAGIGQASVKPNREPIRFWEVTHEQWNRFLTVNATAPIMMARSVVPHMLKANKGRVITVTTSLGTMVRAGYLLYGSSKAAAESSMAVLAADLAGTGVTANVLVPGGVTNTPLVGENAGDRDRMLQPDIMVPPLLWLISDAADGVSGKRFIAADWDVALPADQAADKASAPVAWLSIARMPIEPK